jgi:putative tryptophan/tyrosine transport system substrate-binding protein
MDAAAQQLGVQLHKVALRTPDELAHALAALAQARVEGAFLVGQPWHTNQAARVAALCLEHRLPAISVSAELSQAGLLMSYGWKGEDQARRLAYYLDRILKGAAPAELPVEQPTRLYLRLNLKTARTLGLELPNALRVRADEVIE